MSFPALLCLLALLVHLQCGYSAAAVDDCKENTSNSLALKKQLFCSYDPSVRPVKQHTNTTDVTLHLVLKFLIFDENHNSLHVHSWAIWNWKDEHLTWDKNEFGSLDKLKVSSSDVWIPDVTIFNSGSLDTTGTGMWDCRCTVNYLGNMSCISPTVYTAQCTPNIRRWPFDSHNCSLAIGSWTHSEAELNFSLVYKGVVSAGHYEENRLWELMNVGFTLVTTKYKNKTFPWAIYRFELKRHAGAQVAALVTPAIILSVMTLMTFWLNPEDVYRLGLIGVNIICHCIYMLFLGTMLPANGDETPIIVTFFRDSFLLSAVSLVVTVCVAHMYGAARAPPSWITSITDVMVTLPPGRLLLFGELDSKGVTAATQGQRTEENTDPEGVGGWHLFASLLDRLFFIAFLLTFIILLCAYIP